MSRKKTKRKRTKRRRKTTSRRTRKPRKSRRPTRFVRPKITPIVPKPTLITSTPEPVQPEIIPTQPVQPTQPVESRISLEREVKKIETYEYLLIEYIKEISNEMTYLVLIVVSLFLFVMSDIFPLVEPQHFNIIRLIFVLLIVGGFALFGMSNITKRRIERKFELILT